MPRRRLGVLVDVTAGINITDRAWSPGLSPRWTPRRSTCPPIRWPVSCRRIECAADRRRCRQLHHQHRRRRRKRHCQSRAGDGRLRPECADRHEIDRPTRSNRRPHRARSTRCRPRQPARASPSHGPAPTARAPESPPTTSIVSDQGGPFHPFLMDTTQTSATFTGQVGHVYGFYSVATSNLGLVQPTPTAAAGDDRRGSSAATAAAATAASTPLTTECHEGRAART